MHKRTCGGFKRRFAGGSKNLKCVEWMGSEGFQWRFRIFNGFQKRYRGVFEGLGGFQVCYRGSGGFSRGVPMVFHDVSEDFERVSEAY